MRVAACWRECVGVALLLSGCAGPSLERANGVAELRHDLERVRVANVRNEALVVEPSQAGMDALLGHSEAEIVNVLGAAEDCTDLFSIRLVKHPDAYRVACYPLSAATRLGRVKTSLWVVYDKRKKCVAVVPTATD